MRFLCLHGIGTNVKVLSTQIAAIRAELGDGHIYDFVEGTVRWPKAPELGDMFSDEDEYFAYYDPLNAKSMHEAILQLERYIEVEAPYDGFIAFSHGGALVSSLILGKLLDNTRASDRKDIWQCPFKCAVFLSAGIPWSLDHLRKNELIRLDEKYGAKINIPSAHIWADNDPLGPEMSAIVEALSTPKMRQVSIHKEGHNVPNRRSPQALRSAVQAIRRTLWEAEKYSN